MANEAIMELARIISAQAAEIERLGVLVDQERANHLANDGKRDALAQMVLRQERHALELTGKVMEEQERREKIQASARAMAECMIGGGSEQTWAALPHMALEGGYLECRVCAYIGRHPVEDIIEHAACAQKAAQAQAEEES